LHSATFLPNLAHTISGHLAKHLVKATGNYLHDPARVPLLAGIAAMPSYHVFSWACGLLYWRYLSRWVLAIGIFACALDWLSTVALGWHYALDGAVAVLLVYAAWKVSEVFIRWATPGKGVLARSMDQPEPLPAAASGSGR
jgi:membrane-associated phospholipid phosphatase